MKLRLERRPDGAGLLAVTGRMDAASATCLQAGLRQALERDPRLLLDLAAVEFMDSSGLGVLVASLKAARAAGGDLRLAAASPPVERLLRLTTLDRVFRRLGGDAAWERPGAP